MAKSIYLTKTELIELTGYILANKQIKWLEKNNIEHYVNGAKKPIVLRSTLTSPSQINHSIINNQAPNFEAL
ncbi:DUF4224 domain-containing protein [Gilliamella sp. Imp1-1]|jgi:hypothetical protein|uniref:DUF4224 domain-containing protein n=1 Tax=Gilliamella sp. Imp1-1 TaxID=3120248 RepID=UPI00055209B3|nr:DUF4224 domain-containing protein [Gilliamella apicola]OCG56815.1 hypothetical protein A9G38_09505 [Gilliamella apicola]